MLIHALVASLLMIGDSLAGTWRRNPRQLFLVVAVIVATRGMGRVALMVAGNIQHPPDWDFLIFWINGAMASRHQNFYDPALATQLAAPFHPSAGFTSAALAAPFLYPPPSIFWFIPLGWLEIHYAALLWYVLQLTCFFGAAFVLSLTFFASKAPRHIAFTLALLFLLNGTFGNVANAQTIFMLLLFLSLALRYRNDVSGGVWLALAILVKPWVLVVAVYAVMSRKWRSLAGTGTTLLVATGLTFLIFGEGVFASYVSIPFQNLPMSMYTELENQSLLAWILRITHSPTRFPPIFFVIASTITVITLWRLWQVKEEDQAASFVLLLTVGLLLYPASLRSYTVILILPILVLYRAGEWIPAALAFGLMYLGHGDYMVLGTLVIGIALAVRMPSFANAGTPSLKPSWNRVAWEAHGRRVSN